MGWLELSQQDMMKPLSSATYLLGDIFVEYPRDPETQNIGLTLIPRSLKEMQVTRRTHLDEPEILQMPEPWKTSKAYSVDSLVQVQCIDDERPAGYAQGRTLRNGQTSESLQFVSQEHIKTMREERIETHLKTAHGLEITHYLEYRPGWKALLSWVTFKNQTSREFSLELATSFSMGGITPFDSRDASERLLFHRIRSAWSLEGRLVTETAEELHMERSWQAHSVVCERYGQIGTQPCRSFFSFGAVEDRIAGVCWAAQLEYSGSWQMEFYRRGDCVSFSGGLADREFGHWLKKIAPGETFTTPRSYLTVVQGSVDVACHRLVDLQEKLHLGSPESEESLPVIINEFCTSWGDPNEKNLVSLARTTQDLGAKYLVIDAGWYSKPGEIWFDTSGDWKVFSERFPQGLKFVCDQIRAAGMIPGIWFEMETCGRQSEAFLKTDLHLKRDGIPITVGNRRFWDFRNPVVHEYLANKMILLLKSCQFGYLKIDYNETVGMGVDGCESYGEGIRQHCAGIEQFLKRIRKELPDLVIESCSSGGHRIEPSILRLSDMSSFSDAHETPEVPIIAANMHRMLSPRRSQIWAVLRNTDTEKRMRYVLSSTFLGRMCLSGDLVGLLPQQRELLKEGIDLYHQVAPIIKNGTTLLHREMNDSYRHARGFQSIVRGSVDQKQILVIVHTFEQAPESQCIDLPLGDWSINKAWISKEEPYDLQSQQLRLSLDSWSSAVIHLKEK